MYQMAGTVAKIIYRLYQPMVGWLVVPIGGLLSWKSLMSGIIASVYDNNASNVGSLLF